MELRSYTMLLYQASIGGALKTSGEEGMVGVLRSVREGRDRIKGQSLASQRTLQAGVGRVDGTKIFVKGTFLKWRQSARKINHVNFQRTGMW